MLKRGDRIKYKIAWRDKKGQWHNEFYGQFLEYCDENFYNGSLYGTAIKYEPRLEKELFCRFKYYVPTEVLGDGGIVEHGIWAESSLDFISSPKDCPEYLRNSQ